MTHLTQHHIKALQALVSERESTTDADLIAPHCREWRDKYQGRTPLMMMPCTTDAVSKIVSYCNQQKIAVVPQGGNTGLVGGGLPGLDDRDELLLSLKNMVAVGQVEGTTNSLVASAGATIHSVQEAAKKSGRLFPLSLASEGSCTVGGTIATNAGGIHVIRYGTMRDRVMGLEYVLPNGDIINTLAPVMKDNTGYAMDGMIAGSEGTLGIITQARLKLAPPETHRETVWLGVDSLSDALDVLSSAQTQLAPVLSAFEAMSSAAVNVGKRHIESSRCPVDADLGWHLLIEFGTADNPDTHTEAVMSWLSDLQAKGLFADGAMAQNERQRDAFWALREGLSEAQKKEGASIKHDISIPLDQMNGVVQTALDLIQKLVPGARPTPFGHLGDGNLHFNILQPIGGAAHAFLAEWEKVNEAVHTLVAENGGSISAEHGIGRMKKRDLARLKDQGQLAAMRAVKQALDPHNILNPGVLFAQSSKNT